MMRIDENIIKILVYILSIVSTIFLFRGGLLPGTAVGVAGIFNHLASLLAFSYAWYKTKDKFWLIMLVSVPPLLVSDAYFFPNFSLFFKEGGMLIWAGIHMIVLSLGLTIYSKVRVIKYANLLMLLFSPLTIYGFVGGGPLGMIAFLYLPIVSFSQTYYGIKMGKNLFSSGPILRFTAKEGAFIYYYILGGPRAQEVAGLTDRIAIFARTLMAIGAL